VTREAQRQAELEPPGAKASDLFFRKEDRVQARNLERVGGVVTTQTGPCIGNTAGTSCGGLIAVKVRPEGT